MWAGIPLLGLSVPSIPLELCGAGAASTQPPFPSRAETVVGARRVPVAPQSVYATLMLMGSPTQPRLRLPFCSTLGAGREREPHR